MQPLFKFYSDFFNFADLCFVLRLKMCMLFQHYLQFIILFLICELGFNKISIPDAIAGYFVSATPLIVYSDLFRTLLMFFSWSADVHVVWTLLSIFSSFYNL